MEWFGDFFHLFAHHYVTYLKELINHFKNQMRFAASVEVNQK